jgi:hypothetical protein
MAHIPSSHYKRAYGQTPCKHGVACTRKGSDHWSQFDHPDEHPKVQLLLKLTSGGSQARHGPALDRSKCALGSRDGDDPQAATYTCSGCGTEVVGYGRWRNHMKRAKGKGPLSGPPARGGDVPQKEPPSKRSRMAPQDLAAHHEHVAAWEEPAAEDLPPTRVADAPVPSAPTLAPAEALPTRAAGKAVWRLSGKEKRALAEAAAKAERHDFGTTNGAEASSKPEAKPLGRREGAAPPATEADAAASHKSGEGGVSKRWVTDGAGKNGGKRQRKFY